MNRRGIALVLLAIAAAFSQAQDLTQKVTATYSGISAARLLSDLSQKTGLHLQAAPARSDSIIAIRVADVPLKEVLDRLAKTTGSVWEKNDAGLLLVRSVQAERENEIQNLKRKAEFLRKAVAKLAESVKPAAPWGQEQAQGLARDTETIMNPADGRLNSGSKDVQGLGPRSPASRAVANILLQMDPLELARDLDGKRHVYSSQPTRVQRPMPSGTGPILDQFFREQLLFVSATTAFKATLPPTQSKFSVSGIARGEFEGGNPALGLGGGILSVSRTDEDGSAYIALTLFDPSGGVLCNASTFLTVDREPPTKFEPMPDETAMTPPPLAIEFKKANHVSEGGRGESTYMVMNNGLSKTLRVPGEQPHAEAPPSKELLDFVLHPDKNEPMTLSTGDALVQVAKARHLNLLADLEDSSFAACLALTDKPSAFLSSAKLQARSDVSIAEGWLNVHPKDFDAATQNRVNRAALGKLLQVVKTKRLLMLDDIAQFALSQVKPMSSRDLDLMSLQVVNPLAANRTYDPMNWDAYRLFGSLSMGQRSSLAGGGAIPLRNLTPVALEAVEHMVLVGASEPRLRASDGSRIEPYSGKVVTEWTQLLPSGVPRDGVLTAKVSQDPAAYCVDSATGAAEIVSGEAIAAEKFLWEAPSFHAQGLVTTHDRFAPATLWKYNFTIQFTPNVGIEKDLQDGTFAQNIELTPYDQLPNTLRAAIDKELGELRTAFGKTNFGNQGGSGTPPP